MSFAELGLAPELLRALAEEGYTEPTPIQKQAIPMVASGRDLLAAAQTGTGKTAAFTLPILHRLAAADAGSSGPDTVPDRREVGAGGAASLARSDGRVGGESTRTRTQPSGHRGASGGPARVLVLVPTRELAAQVAESVRTYGRHFKLRTAVIFGGVGINPQIDLLRRGVDIIVATPGRLLDHLSQRTVNLSGIQTLVLDEADRMLDMGFIRDIRKVLAVLLPKQRQNLLFSATFNPEIRSLAQSLLHDPVTVDVSPRNTPTELVAQRVHPVDKARKTALLAHLVKSGDWKQVLVFTRTKHGANRLAEQLQRAGIHADAIHGNKSQNARTRALADFKAGKVRVLVATDIAARGIDIDQLPHVVNHELPHVPEDYVHRIGRTGRAGVSGEAISLVSSEERTELKDIQRLLKREIPSSVVEGFAPGSPPTAQEIEQRGAVKLPDPAALRAGRHQPPGHGRQRNGGSFRPQRDAERRSGKSRKVH